MVTAPGEVLRDLDVQLWTFGPLDFVPHCRADAPAAMQSRTPIVLSEAARSAPHQEVLVNLGEDVPDGFERFERLIELVSSDPDDRIRARRRWKHYADRGYAIQRHDLGEPRT